MVDTNPLAKLKALTGGDMRIRRNASKFINTLHDYNYDAGLYGDIIDAAVDEDTLKLTLLVYQEYGIIIDIPGTLDKSIGFKDFIETTEPMYMQSETFMADKRFLLDITIESEGCSKHLDFRVTVVDSDFATEDPIAEGNIIGSVRISLDNVVPVLFLS